MIKTSRKRKKEQFLEILKHLKMLNDWGKKIEVKNTKINASDPTKK